MCSLQTLRRPMQNLLRYASRMSRQVTAARLYGGMTLPFAMGAVVLGVPTTSQTPLTGQRSPVRAVVPICAVISGFSLVRECCEPVPQPLHFRELHRWKIDYRAFRQPVKTRR